MKEKKTKMLFPHLYTNDKTKEHSMHFSLAAETLGLHLCYKGINCVSVIFSLFSRILLPVYWRTVLQGSATKSSKLKFNRHEIIVRLA